MKYSPARKDLLSKGQVKRSVNNDRLIDVPKIMCCKQASPRTKPSIADQLLYGFIFYFSYFIPNTCKEIKMEVTMNQVGISSLQRTLMDQGGSFRRRLCRCFWEKVSYEIVSKIPLAVQVAGCFGSPTSSADWPLCIGRFLQ